MDIPSMANRDWIEHDPALAPLRKHRGYRALLAGRR
jgi:hypothetical protein